MVTGPINNKHCHYDYDYHDLVKEPGQVDRCVVMGRLLPPYNKEQILTTHTSSTNNTEVIISDNNNVITFSLDFVLPITAPTKQVCGNC